MHTKEVTAIAARVMRPQAAAAYLDLAPGTLAKMRMRGEGPPFIKYAKAVRYRQEDCDAWLLTRRRRSTSEAA